MRSSIRHAGRQVLSHHLQLSSYSRKVNQYKKTHICSSQSLSHTSREDKRERSRVAQFFILSHCKIFGTRDGGTGRRAGDVSGPSNSHAHVSTRSVSAPRSALYSNLLFGWLSTHLVIIAQHKALPRQPRECPNRNIESGVMGSWTVSYLNSFYQTYDPQNSETYIVIVIQRIQQSITQFMSVITHL